jgi:hypothetical protein
MSYSLLAWASECRRQKAEGRMQKSGVQSLESKGEGDGEKLKWEGRARGEAGGKGRRKKEECRKGRKLPIADCRFPIVDWGMGLGLVRS